MNTRDSRPGSVHVMVSFSGHMDTSLHLRARMAVETRFISSVRLQHVRDGVEMHTRHWLDLPTVRELMDAAEAWRRERS